MSAVTWYAISLAIIPSLSCIIRVHWLDIADIWRAFRRSNVKHLTLGATRVQILTLLVYGAANIGILFIGFRGQLSTRLATMMEVNMIPLFLGGRTSFLCNYGLRIPLPMYRLLHHWIGLVVICQGLLHAILASLDHGTAHAQVVSGIIATITLCLLFISSLPGIRSLLYQVFPKTHLALATVTLCIMLWHLRISNVTLLCPCIAVVLWLVNFCLRLFNIIRYSRGATASITTKDSNTSARISVFIRPRINIRPGQYFYLYFWELPIPDKFHAHPLMVISSDTKKEGTIIDFMMEERERIGKLTSREQRGTSIILDGPWGVELGLENYEVVTLYGNGVGAAGLLASAFYVCSKMQRVDTTKTVTKKLVLKWAIDTNQHQWFWDDFIKLRKEQPQNSRCQTELFGKSCDEESYYTSDAPVGDFTNRRIVVACGPEDFIEDVRKLVAEEDVSFLSPAHFVELELRPTLAETKASEPTWWSTPNIRLVQNIRLWVMQMRNRQTKVDGRWFGQTAGELSDLHNGRAAVIRRPALPVGSHFSFS